MLTADHQNKADVASSKDPMALQLYTDTAYLATPLGKRRLTVPTSAALLRREHPCVRPLLGLRRSYPRY